MNNVRGTRRDEEIRGEKEREEDRAGTLHVCQSGRVDAPTANAKYLPGITENPLETDKIGCRCEMAVAVTARNSCRSLKESSRLDRTVDERRHELR